MIPDYDLPRTAGFGIKKDEPRFTQFVDRRAARPGEIRRGRENLQRLVRAGKAAVRDQGGLSRRCKPNTVPSLLGRVVVKRFQNFSIDPALMSVAGSALLFGIGTEARP